jgi:hypothetical protein
MSKRKIPQDAFEFYFSLGPERSYEQVAGRYGVTKRAVTKLAARERWQERLEKVEAEARSRSDQKKVEALEAAKERHMQALRPGPREGDRGPARDAHRLDSPADAIRAIGLAVREMRVELGEPSDRTAVTVEEAIKREYARWMVPAPEEEVGEPGEGREVPGPHVDGEV